jgi:hypothetical protein
MNGIVSAKICNAITTADPFLLLFNNIVNRLSCIGTKKRASKVWATQTTGEVITKLLGVPDNVDSYNTKWRVRHF